MTLLIDYETDVYKHIALLGGNVPTVLHEVPVPIIDKVKCQTMFTKSGHKKIVRDSFLCAGYDEGKRDSCEVKML